MAKQTMEFEVGKDRLEIAEALGGFLPSAKGNSDQTKRYMIWMGEWRGTNGLWCQMTDGHRMTLVRLCGAPKVEDEENPRKYVATFTPAAFKKMVKGIKGQSVTLVGVPVNGRFMNFKKISDPNWLVRVSGDAYKPIKAVGARGDKKWEWVVDWNEESLTFRHCEMSFAPDKLEYKIVGGAQIERPWTKFGEDTRDYSKFHPINYKGYQFHMNAKYVAEAVAACKKVSGHSEFLMGGEFKSPTGDEKYSELLSKHREEGTRLPDKKLRVEEDYLISKKSIHFFPAGIEYAEHFVMCFEWMGAYGKWYR